MNWGAVLLALGLTLLTMGLGFGLIVGGQELIWWVGRRWGQDKELWVIGALAFLVLFPFILLGALSGWK